ncbi:MAG: ABC transporter ATP-binding protein/permease [Clostridia bacterium]|nr:ABC transporter ATP-binding protein/permease [Clostridia bacterium]
MLKLVKKFTWKDYLLIAVSAFLIVFQVFLELKMPDYTGELTKAVSSGNVNIKDIWSNGGMMLLCSFGNIVAAIVCSLFLSKFANNLANNLRVEIYNKVSSFSSKEMDSFSIASLITRTTNDVAQVQMFYSLGLQILIKAPVLAIWAICKISVSSIEWTTAVIIAVSVIIVVVGLVVGVVLPKFKKIQKLIDNLNEVTRENITGVRVIRAFNAENFQENKFEKANNELTQNQLFTQRTIGFLMPTISLIMNGLTLAIYWIGAVLINNASSVPERLNKIGDMTIFTQYSLQIVMSFIMLIAVFIILPRALVSAKRINEVLDTKPSIVDGKVEDQEDKGEIVFDKVCFAYNHDGKYVLKDISFEAHKGETVSIIGATGSGKSSMLHLLNRFYDVDAGHISVDGVDVKDYKLTTLRKKIAYISQKARLFSGNIKENVAYGDTNIDEEKVKQSLKLAEANFVFDLEDGINAPVAQGGTNFSGGQKQRLSIARAMYKDAEIIVFDDSFSALDYKTDMKVRKNLKKVFKDKIVIIVAQRIGTIKNSDKIIVLDQGKVVGLGKHEELLNTCQVYKDIALSQLDKEEL